VANPGELAKSGASARNSMAKVDLCSISAERGDTQPPDADVPMSSAHESVERVIVHLNGAEHAVDGRGDDLFGCLVERPGPVLEDFPGRPVEDERRRYSRP
jgi:hypothetical protein